MLTSRHRLGYLCKNNKYDQAKYFLDIYSDSAEMSREKSIFCVSVVYCRWTRWCLLLLDRITWSSRWARELNEGHKKCRWHGLTDEFMPCYKDWTAWPYSFLVLHICHAFYRGDPCQLSWITSGHGVIVALMAFVDNVPATEEKKQKDNAPSENSLLSDKQPSTWKLSS